MNQTTEFFPLGTKVFCKDCKSDCTPKAGEKPECKCGSSTFRVVKPDGDVEVVTFG